VQIGKSNWASSPTEFLTLARGQTAPKSTNFALYIGVGTYALPGIPALPAGKSLDHFAETMKLHCGYTDSSRIIVLKDRDATLTRIKEAFEQLRSSTQAGDEVAIYWNGHGVRMAATESTHSPDGQRGYLIPYDVKTVADNSNLPDAKSMISDLQLAQWINSMNDRKIFVFLDACFAGTFVEAPIVRQSFALLGGEQSPEILSQSVSDDRAPEPGVDFLGNVMARTRSILRDDAVVICASQRDEESWAIAGVAIATRFFCETVNKASGSLTVDDVFNSMSRDIPAELTRQRRTHPQITIQVPVLQGKAKEFVLKK